MAGPKKAVAYVTTIALYDAAVPGALKANPTIASGDFKISKDNGALANLTNLPSVSPAGSVMLQLSLTSTEMNADRISIVGIDQAGAEWTDFHMALDTESLTLTDVDARLPAALVSGRMDASVGAYQSGQAPLQPTVAGRTLDVTTTGEAGIDWANVGAPTTAVTLSNTTIKDAVDVNTDTDLLLARLGTPSNLGGGATVAANLSDIESQTDDIGAAGAGLTAVPWNAAWDAEVQSEVNDALADQNLDHLMKVAVDTDFPTTVHLNSVIGHLADNGGTATFDRATDSHEALYNKLVDVETDTQDIQTTVNLILSSVDTEVAAILAAVDTEVAAIKAKTDQLTFTAANKVDATMQAASDLATAVGNKIADMVLRRTAANIEASSFGDTLGESSLYGMARRASHSDTTTHPGKHTIFKTDASELAQITITVDDAAQDITGFTA
jgi:hypothetical protein